MKKFLSLAAAALLSGLCAVPALAADSAEVSVTIADDKGALALEQAVITVTDIDGDGVLTINDALSAAHATFFADGADGYASANTEFGVSMTKLWGIENGGAYGYYVNNASAWSLTDPISDGDYIKAFVYTDTVGWSDTYSFFDIENEPWTVTVASDTITLTLNASAYDENFNPITVPVENAVITINGETTAYRTDANGKVTIPLEQDGVITISAVSDSMTLVPPVCRFTASRTAPATGDGMLWLIPALLASGCLAAVTAKKKHEN